MRSDSVWTRIRLYLWSDSGNEYVGNESERMKSGLRETENQLEHDWLWRVEAAVARELNLMQRLIDEATEQAKSTQVNCRCI